MPHPCLEGILLDVDKCPSGCVIKKEEEEESEQKGGSRKKRVLNVEDEFCLVQEFSNNKKSLLVDNKKFKRIQNWDIYENDGYLLYQSLEQIEEDSNKKECVLDKCAKYSNDNCLIHVEDFCVPSEDGCRFFFFLILFFKFFFLFLLYF
jgi:hypothetical protein